MVPRPTLIGWFEIERLEPRQLLTTASVDSNHILQIVGTSSAESIVVNALSNGKIGVSGVTTQFTAGSASGQFTKINIDAGGGNDTLQINGNVPYSGATLGGGGGNDTLTGGSAADLLSGGSGFDTANYSLRTVGVNVSLDGAANDGQSGEK